MSRHLKPMSRHKTKLEEVDYDATLEIYVATLKIYVATKTQEEGHA